MSDLDLSVAEGQAKRILEGLGFAARKIPRTHERTADFDVVGDGPGYLVEVKSRLLDERLANPSEPIGDLVEKSMRHDPAVVKWLSNSKQQFRAQDPRHERLWFLWCAMEAPFGRENQAERIISVLYGARIARDIEPPHRMPVVLYAKPAAFDGFPEIDGAVVALPEDSLMTFCPNEGSPRFDAVMRSQLVRSLRHHGMGPILPTERAAAMKGYVVPKNVRGKGDVAALRYVQQATGLPYLNFMAIEVEYMQTGRIPQAAL